MVSKRIVIDQMGRNVEVPYLPQRIVSLVPSQTELLYDLGLSDEIVGQTLFCIHPQAMHQIKPRVGGTKNFKLAKIAELKPDLIIGNKEENDRGGIEELSKHYPVWMSDIQTLDDALDMIQKIGDLVGKVDAAHLLVRSIRSSFEELEEGSWRLADGGPQLEDGSVFLANKVKWNKRKTAYFIWRKPWMVAGHDTFISDMLNRLGFENVFHGEPSRYPEVTEAMLKEANPECLLLSSEPYPFKQEHLNELQAICPNAKILLVDGELFSWYGSRLQYAVPYFKKIMDDLYL
jgi:ABC-type Fe3+-hydroxamate transport system substrate-binding protein